MAKPVAQAPDVGHFVHFKNELSVPCTLADGQFPCIPQTTIVWCCEITCKWVDVITISGFISNGIIQLKQGHPFFEVRKNHFCWCWRCHLLVFTISIGERISESRDDLDSCRITWCKPNLRPRDDKLIDILNGATTESRTSAQDPLFLITGLALCCEKIPFRTPIIAQGFEIKSDHVFGWETEDLITVVGAEIRFSFVEIHSIRLHEVKG